MYPPQKEELKQKLLGGYRCPDSAPNPPVWHLPRELTLEEELTFKHFIAWQQTNGTVKAYNAHKKVLEDATGTKLLSLHSARKLASSLTSLTPKKYHMCPASCMAFTGDYESLSSCSHMNKKTLCGEPRYRGSSQRPRAEMLYLSPEPFIRSYFATTKTAEELQYRHKSLQNAIGLLDQASRKFSDFADSNVHINQYQKMGLFQSSKDCAWTLSTDGAQLTMKKQSNTWVFILILLNYSPDKRYKSENVLIPLTIPGPNSPGNIESFVWPLYQDMARFGEGIWMWDALTSSWFVHRSYCCTVNGDMLGSAKFSGLGGHLANKGDRFSMVEAARAEGTKAQYYPVACPDNARLNPSRPAEYDLDNLPKRTTEAYWAAHKKLFNVLLQISQGIRGAKALQKRIQKETGIIRMPTIAVLDGLDPENGFPIDSFHLFFENIAAWIWDIWTIHSDDTERIHISQDQAKEFGEEITKAMTTLPPSFCGVVRDPHLKRQSQYKIYEWMALLYWYILPIGLELKWDSLLLINFSQLVSIIEFSMTIKPRSLSEIEQLHQDIKIFLKSFENLYVQGDPTKVSRYGLYF